MLRFGVEGVEGVEHLSNSTLPYEHRRKLHVGMSEVGLMSDSLLPHKDICHDLIMIGWKDRTRSVA
jgi:hypothetical protein